MVYRVKPKVKIVSYFYLGTTLKSVDEENFYHISDGRSKLNGKIVKRGFKGGTSLLSIALQLSFFAKKKQQLKSKNIPEPCNLLSFYNFAVDVALVKHLLSFRTCWEFVLVQRINSQQVLNTIKNNHVRNR